MHGHKSGRRPSRLDRNCGLAPQGDGYESMFVADDIKRNRTNQQTFRLSRLQTTAERRLRPHAAFMPCRLCDASFTVKNTTSASGVALPACTVLDGI